MVAGAFFFEKYLILLFQNNIQSFLYKKQVKISQKTGAALRMLASPNEN
jgi:hypothetical protein